MKFLTLPVTKRERERERERERSESNLTPAKFSLVTNYHKLSLLTLVVRP